MNPEHFDLIESDTSEPSNYDLNTGDGVTGLSNGDSEAIPSEYTLVEKDDKRRGPNTAVTGISAGLIAAGVAGGTIAQNGVNYVDVRNVVSSIDLGLVDNEAETAAFLESHSESIARIAAEYDLPEEAFYIALGREIGHDNENAMFGIISKLDEQKLKAFINYVRGMSGMKVDKRVVFDRNGNPIEYESGPSFGVHNLKPGVISLQVVDAIKDDALRDLLLGTYNYESMHADTRVVANVLANFDHGVEIMAAVMDLWKESIMNTNVEPAEEQDLIRAVLFSFAALNSPYDGMPFYDEDTGVFLLGANGGEGYKLVNFKPPDLRDPRDLEPVEN